MFKNTHRVQTCTVKTKAKTTQPSTLLSTVKNLLTPAASFVLTSTIQNLKDKVAEELIMAHEGLCANDGRIGNKPGGHALAARPPTTKTNNNANLGLGQGFSLSPNSTQNLIIDHQPRVLQIICKWWVSCYSSNSSIMHNHCLQVKNLMISLHTINIILVWFFCFTNQILCVREMFIYTRVICITLNYLCSLYCFKIMFAFDNSKIPTMEVN